MARTLVFRLRQLVDASDGRCQRARVEYEPDLGFYEDAEPWLVVVYTAGGREYFHAATLGTAILQAEQWLGIYTTAR